MKERLGEATGHDGRMLGVPNRHDQWAHVQDARAYDAPPASEVRRLSRVEARILIDS